MDSEFRDLAIVRQICSNGDQNFTLRLQESPRDSEGY